MCAALRHPSKYRIRRALAALPQQATRASGAGPAREHGGAA